jgi:Flp pilus assembly protein TadB
MKCTLWYRSTDYLLERTSKNCIHVTQTTIVSTTNKQSSLESHKIDRSLEERRRRGRRKNKEIKRYNNNDTKSSEQQKIMKLFFVCVVCPLGWVHHVGWLVGLSFLSLLVGLFVLFFLIFFCFSQMDYERMVSLPGCQMLLLLLLLLLRSNCVMKEFCISWLCSFFFNSFVSPPFFCLLLVS